MSDRLKKLTLKSDPYKMISTVKKNHPDLNSVERQLMLDQPALVRLPSHIKPTAITVEVPINHNPDFMLYHYFVEVKGRVYKREWISLLERLPRPDRYKIVLCAQSRKDRDRLRKQLDKRCPQIEYCEYEQEQLWKSKWVSEAIRDWFTSSLEDKLKTIELIRRMTGDVPVHYSI